MEWGVEELRLQKEALLQQRADTAAGKAQLVIALAFKRQQLAKAAALTKQLQGDLRRRDREVDGAAMRNRRLQWWVRWWAERSQSQEDQLRKARPKPTKGPPQTELARKDALIADLQRQLQSANDLAAAGWQAAYERVPASESLGWQATAESLEQTLKESQETAKAQLARKDQAIHNVQEQLRASRAEAAKVKEFSRQLEVRDKAMREAVVALDSMTEENKTLRKRLAAAQKSGETDRDRPCAQ